MTALSSQVALACPECGNPTHDLKHYRYVHWCLCLLVFYSYEIGAVTGCPSCVRKRLLDRTLINLVPANLLWLALVLPFHLIQLARSYSSGHSAAIQLER
jgi:hypothetical protein